MIYRRDGWNKIKPPEGRGVMMNVNGKVRIDPQFCDHADTVHIKTGHRWAIAGDVSDNLDDFEQCLTCGAVRQDDGSWAMHHPDLRPETEISF
jgi:hypothetical protein